ncbi:alpha/beta fold hydrolase [Hymenobacter aquaticus]|uniref:Alpha/beta fold hydrolase n=1 Tax=Hymenobacter aquaticus TaxID=1867101 RepID=A0A4Z0Q457_9BACT|nr:alpha/beta fold hydrolase [Hymenobacter aquaticus]TGE24266.1 alpha/beta fold hydrolase [Hymenobacter aquaticus]
MALHYIRQGAGPALLLVHGIGGSWRSWNPLLDALTAAHEVIAVDLPGHGASPPLAGAHTIATLADALTAFLTEHDLLGIDAVGSSMGARLVLELARRGGVLGAVVALDPGGFWAGWEVPFFYHSVAISQKLVTALQPVMPALMSSAVGRTALLPQFSARPWALPTEHAQNEMYSLAHTPVFGELLDTLAHGPAQQGAPAGSLPAPLVIGWGQQDRVCLPAQAARAVAKFPDARLHWFANCGHFPQWDQPAEAARLILATLRREPFRDQDIARFAQPPAPARAVPTTAIIASLAVAALGSWLLYRRQKAAGS